MKPGLEPERAQNAPGEEQQDIFMVLNLWNVL